MRHENIVQLKEAGHGSHRAADDSHGEKTACEKHLVASEQLLFYMHTVVLQHIAPLQLFRCQRAQLWGLPKERKAISRLRIRWKEHAWYSGSLDLKEGHSVMMDSFWGGEDRLVWGMIMWSHPKPLIEGPPVNASLPIAFNRVSVIGKCFHWRIHWEFKLLRPEYSMYTRISTYWWTSVCN